MPNPWVFGYGSLIWKPGFAFLRSETALLRGAHRALSIYSHRHRGTPERPGLVFGLSRGGSCRGVAFEVDATIWPEVFAYLQAREQDRGVYREAWRKVALASGDVVTALAYLVNEGHPQFAGELDLAPFLGPCRVIHAIGARPLIEWGHLSHATDALPPRVLVRTCERAPIDQFDARQPLAAEMAAQVGLVHGGDRVAAHGRMPVDAVHGAIGARAREQLAEAAVAPQAGLAAEDRHQRMRRRGAQRSHRRREVADLRRAVEGRAGLVVQ